MSSTDIIVQLRALGQAAFKSAMDSSAESVDKVGKSAKDTDKAVDSAGKTAGKSTSRWKSAARGVAGWAASGAAIAAIGAYTKTAVNSAVDLGEEINKTGVVFRQSSGALINWSKDSATALGMSRQQALAASGTFGNMLVPMGFARGKAADMSRSMVTLAADMASFNNASPDETLAALRAGLAGETEPLRRFGVFLSDARLRQEALNMGLKVGKGPLDANIKAQATYGLILKDTKDAQGDFNRTSGSLANQQRILKAQWTNLAATMGKTVLPAALALAKVLGFLMNNMAIVAPLIGIVVTAWVAYKVATIAAAIATMGLNASILLIPLAVAAVIAGLVIAYMKIAWFRNAVNAAFQWIKQNWPLLVGILAGPFGLAAVLIAKHWDKVKATARGLIDWFKKFGSNIVTSIADGIKSAPTLILDAITSALPGGGVGKAILSKIPGLQFGGVMGHTGYSVVGERGPELLQLPGGTRITPLPTAAPSLPSLAGASASQTTAHFYLDRRLIATAVADDTSDRKARR